MVKTFDLNEVFGKPETVKIRNVDIDVFEVTMINFQAFTEACAPFLSAFDDPARLGIGDDGKKPDGFAFFTEVSSHSDAFLNAAVLVTDAPKAWLQRLPPDDFFVLIQKIIEVNARFFTQRLAPAMLNLATSLAAVLGSNLSTFLSQAAIE
jgi:hypothetical protein